MAQVTLCVALTLAFAESILAVTLLAPGGLDWTGRFQHIWTVQIRSAASVAIPALFLVGIAFAALGRAFRWKWPAWWFGVLVFLLFFDFFEYSNYLRLSASTILGLGLGVQAARWFARNPEPVIRWSRRLLPGLAAIALLSTVGYAVGERWMESRNTARLPDAPANAPNVLLIVLDTQRADFLSSYGYPRQTTPFLDSLAARGVLFERAYAGSSWTLPSHAVLMSGRFVFEHSIRTAWGETQALDPRHPVLAEVFQRNGYATGGFAANPWYCAPRQGFGRGFLRYRDTSYRLEAMLRRTGAGSRIVQYLFPRLGWYHDTDTRRADVISGDFLSWLDRVRGRPFFAFLNYMEPHGPLLPPREFAARFSSDPDKLMQRKPVNFLELMKDSTTPEMREMERDAYAASVAYLDSQLAELYRQLQDRGLDHNLLLVITSDHGEAFGQHGLYGHRVALYTSMIHVPLILHFPGRIPEGMRISPPVTQRTLAATLVDLAGLADDNPFPGPALSGAWAQIPDWDPGPVLSEVSGNPYGGGPDHWPIRKGWLKSWMTPRWQYILRADGFEELFDLQNDPRQSRNWALTPEGKPVAKEIRDRLEELVPQARSAPHPAGASGNGL
jgi:arylsulfatase A-like enzyme